MDVSHLIGMILFLPNDDKARIRAALNAEAVGIGNVDVLDIPLGDNDANAATVRDYFKALLQTLWREGEGFSGKRPFGNSGWQYDFDDALVRSGKVHGSAGSDDERAEIVDDAGREAADELISAAIEAL